MTAERSPHSVAEMLVDGVQLVTYPEQLSLAEAYLSLVEQLETLREVLREITATNWREIKDGVAYNQETSFQFEQRIHKIAADALMGIGSNPASRPPS